MYIKKILDITFPLIGNWEARKIIRGKMFPKNELGEETIPTGILTNIENSDRISVEELKEQYENTFKTKDKLESKAKTNIIGITISISLIIGASELLSFSGAKFENSFVTLFATILFIASVTYMTVAGLFVIHVLIGENETYIVKLSSIVNDKETSRDDYDKCIAQNQKKNTISNNYVFTSYACTRSSLACLFIILLFIAIPNDLSNNNYQRDDIKIHSSQIYVLSFSSSTINYLKESDVRDIVEKAVIGAMEESQPDEGDGTFGIIGTSNTLFIKYGVSGKNIKILLLESYTIQ